MDARAGDAAYRSDPNRKYITASRNADWDKDLTETAAGGADRASLYSGFFEHGLKITGMAHRAGVRIMAGSDANDTMIFPGFSLHRELWLLSRAGMPAMDVLRAATSVPAAYLGKTGTLGGISAGKEADLVLLQSDPLKDVRNTQSISAVIVDGKHYDRAALDQLLAEAERVAKAEPPAR
jgi:cytosine/adenosine deaminase-related metal-dependent hydrolase